MNITPLYNIPAEEIINCFLAAFRDYYVPMPEQKQYYQERWNTAKVDYSLSYGLFDQKQLVGFVLHAVDRRNDLKVAYNAATGVLPHYRKRGFVQQLYAHALPIMTKEGIEHIRLEVITHNQAAIGAYTKVGFKICKHYHCFGGSISGTSSTPSVEVREIPLKTIQWNTLPNQHLYSWENQGATLSTGPYRFFQVLHNTSAESFFILHQNGEYLAQLDVFTEKENAWNRLFTAIHQYAPAVKLNNVDNRLKNKLEQLKGTGLQSTVDQYEMEMFLKHKKNLV